MHYLITGHTGFKGAWLTTWLLHDGHQVSGYALDPEPGSLFQRANLGPELTHDIRADIRNPQTLTDAVEAIQPDVVIHLAAQALVRESSRNPRTTFETNVMGTLNLLEATQHTPSVQARLIITTDKVYRDNPDNHGYTETDPLGGNDPYSASKAMADILTHSWTTSFQGPPTAVARAGNVIGGGDICQDRLVPDIIHSLQHGHPIQLRNPNAIRPWQHVLDCLNGYRTLINWILTHPEEPTDRGAWNFGPNPENLLTVSQITELLVTAWGHDSQWHHDLTPNPDETARLVIDPTKATTQLGWTNQLDAQASVRMTAQWAKRVDAGEPANRVTQALIREFARMGVASL